MKPTILNVLVALSTVCLAGTAFAQDFRFSLDAPEQLTLPAGSTETLTVRAQLETSGIDGPGAAGWSLGLTVDGATILSATTEGTVGATVSNGGLRSDDAEDSFENTESTTGPGNEGVVSAVLLSFMTDTTVNPADSPSPILVLELEVTAPETPTDCSTVTIEFVDGLVGSGQAVDNKVTYRGQTIRPELVGATVEVCAARDCRVEPLATIIQASNTGESETLFAGSPEGGVITAFGPAGQPGAATVYAGIVSDLTGDGAQGWSISIATPGLEAVSATTEGTPGRDKQSGGFEKTETIDPEVGEQGHGVVSAVVLSFTEPINLPAVGTTTVLAVGVATPGPLEEGANQYGSVEYLNNRRGSGQPVRNVVTIDGNSVEPCHENALLRFVVAPAINFVRGDPNDDSRVDIADPIWIVNELFGGGPPTLCQDAADVNDDGMVDLTDAAVLIAYQFEGGEEPPAPFASSGARDGCGEDPTDDLLICDRSVSSCE